MTLDHSAIKWLAQNRFSNYDALWLMGFGALMNDGQYLWAFAALLAGAATSGALEANMKRKEPTP